MTSDESALEILPKLQDLIPYDDSPGPCTSRQQQLLTAMIKNLKLYSTYGSIKGRTCENYFFRYVNLNFEEELKKAPEYPEVNCENIADYDPNQF